MVVVAVHRLRLTGMRPDEAHKQAAAVCRAVGLKRSRSGKRPGLDVDERTVRYWCARISQDVGRHTVLARDFDRQLGYPSTAEDMQQVIEANGVKAVRESVLEILRGSLVRMRALEH